jgi:hypothetical protein
LKLEYTFYPNPNYIGKVDPYIELEPAEQIKKNDRKIKLSSEAEFNLTDLVAIPSGKTIRVAELNYMGGNEYNTIRNPRYPRLQGEVELLNNNCYAESAGNISPDQRATIGIFWNFDARFKLPIMIKFKG